MAPDIVQIEAASVNIVALIRVPTGTVHPEFAVAFVFKQVITLLGCGEFDWNINRAFPTHCTFELDETLVENNPYVFNGVINDCVEEKFIWLKYCVPLSVEYAYGPSNKLYVDGNEMFKTDWVILSPRFIN
jgi:hypothetical protein